MLCPAVKLPRLHAEVGAALGQRELVTAPLHVVRASYRSYRLPLRLPLTTTAPAGGQGFREGFYLQILAEAEGCGPDGAVEGLGEVAPLPGERALMTCAP